MSPHRSNNCRFPLARLRVLAGSVANRLQWRRVLGLVLLTGILIGCGKDPVARQKLVERVRQQVAAKPVEGKAAAAAPEAEHQEEANRPVAKNPLIKGIGELLESNPALEDETKSPLREQLEQADEILSSIKSQNRAILKEVNRQQRTRRSTSPNIVVFVINDLAVSDLPAFGNSKIQTPNIDRLAVSGTKFTQFYAGSPRKADAHWCLAAGRRPDESAHWNGSSAVLLPENITIAEAMWQAGYTTGLFGDWGVPGPDGPAIPADQGFEEWLGTFASVDQAVPFPSKVLFNGRPIAFTKNANGQRGQLAQDFYIAEAADFLLRSFRQHPLYLQVHFSTTGIPATPAELQVYAEQPWSDAEKARAAALTRIDRDIGKLLQRLSDIKQLGNTIFIVTSDVPGQPFPTASSEGNAAKLRGGPGELYEGGLRIPLIMTGKSRIPVNFECSAVAALWDLPPTIFQLTSTLKQPPRKAGQSLLPFLAPNAKSPVRFLYWERQHGSSEIAARWKNWKVVRPAGKSQFELYDLESDPFETRNVAEQHPDIIAEIDKRLTPSTEQAQR